MAASPLQSAVADDFGLHVINFNIHIVINLATYLDPLLDSIINKNKLHKRCKIKIKSQKIKCLINLLKKNTKQKKRSSMLATQRYKITK